MMKYLYIIILVFVFILSPTTVQAGEQCIGLGDEEICVMVDDKNVLGTELKPCGIDPVTGFFRNGFCQTNMQDRGVHVVCAEVTDEFLQYSKSQGNDLITPNPRYGFEGLKEGDHWCLCAARWAEAQKAGVAPPLNLEATHSSMLDYVDLETLKNHAVKNNEQN